MDLPFRLMFLLLYFVFNLLFDQSVRKYEQGLPHICVVSCYWLCCSVCHLVLIDSLGAFSLVAFFRLCFRRVYPLCRLLALSAIFFSFTVCILCSSMPWRKKKD